MRLGRRAQRSRVALSSTAPTSLRSRNNDIYEAMEEPASGSCTASNVPYLDTALDLVTCA